MEYKALENMTWEQILREKGLPTPRSVSMQIQPISSQYFMHIDPSFNIHAREIFPDTPELGEKSWEFLKKKKIYELDFAFDRYAKTFSQYRTHFHRIDNINPVIVGEYFADGLNYTFTYFSNQTEKYIQDITTVEIKIKNNNPKLSGNGLVQPEFDGRQPKAPNSKLATIYIKPKWTLGVSGHNDNYVPFRFNNKLWSYDENLELLGSKLKFKDGNIFGNILDTDMEYSLFDTEYENIQGMMDKDQGHIHPTDINIDYPHSDEILEKLVNTVRFQKDIAPGEECYITINLLGNYKDNSENSLTALNNKYYYKDTINTFENARENKADLTFKSENLGDIYKTCQNAVLQLCTDFKEKDYFLPTQGGINDRYYCWIWEAMCMLEPMLALGYDSLVKECTKFMFTLQDSGVLPEGEFTDFDGAIGSTGPRWICTTGSAVNMASLYLAYTKDKEFKTEFLPKMKKAVDWILRQTENTKIYENNKKVPYFGLLPRGTMNDGDYCYGIGFSDLFSFVGVQSFTKTLKQINSPLYEEYKVKCDEYQENIKNAFRLLVQPDGSIKKHVPSDKESFYVGFESTATYLFGVDIFNQKEKILTDFAKYIENYSADDIYLHNANEEESYMGTQEMNMQYHYLSSKQFKKAWITLYANLKYGMSEDTYQVLERYSKYDRFWCPWQPNGSGSGRMINMINRSIYFETEDKILLFCGLPPVYLFENGITELKDLRTPEGKISVRAEAEEDRIKVSITGDYDRNKKIVFQSDKFYIE
ncbi:MAG: hypothetical protein KBT47_05760 [Armatimonadetes bacterium]|nr:hypothetical protein [Candidatus Hippobium faecium]